MIENGRMESLAATTISVLVSVLAMRKINIARILVLVTPTLAE